MCVIVMFSALLYKSARKQLCYLHADMENEEWRNRHIYIYVDVDDVSNLNNAMMLAG